MRQEHRTVANEIRDAVDRPTSHRMGSDLGPLDLRAVAEALGAEPDEYATTPQLRRAVAEAAGINNPPEGSAFSVDEKEAVLDALVG